MAINITDNKIENKSIGISITAYDPNPKPFIPNATPTFEDFATLKAHYDTSKFGNPRDDGTLDNTYQYFWTGGRVTSSDDPDNDTLGERIIDSERKILSIDINPMAPTVKDSPYYSINPIFGTNSSTTRIISDRAGNYDYTTDLASPQSPVKVWNINWEKLAFGIWYNKSRTFIQGDIINNLLSHITKISYNNIFIKSRSDMLFQTVFENNKIKYVDNTGKSYLEDNSLTYSLPDAAEGKFKGFRLKPFYGFTDKNYIQKGEQSGLDQWERYQFQSIVWFSEVYDVYFCNLRKPTNLKLVGNKLVFDNPNKSFFDNDGHTIDLLPKLNQYSYIIYKDGVEYDTVSMLNQSWDTIVYTIPDKDYKNTTHTWSVKFDQADNIILLDADREARVRSGHAVSDYHSEYLDYCRHNFYVFRDSDISRSTAWENVGKYDTPSNINADTEVNTATITWEHTLSSDVQFVLTVGNTEYTTSDKSYTVKNLSLGSHAFTLGAYQPGNKDTSLSVLAQGSFSTVALDAPTEIKFTRSGIDKGEVSWKSAYKDNKDTEYIVELGTDSFTTNDTKLEIKTIAQGEATIKVYQKFTPDEDYNSDKSSVDIDMTKLSAPYELKFSRNTVNSGIITWKSVQEDTVDTTYEVYLNDSLYDTTNNLSMVINNIPQGDNNLKIYQTFTPNPDYNSTYNEVNITLTKIVTPTISYTENYSDVVYVDPNTGEKTFILDENGNRKQGVGSITVKWDTTDLTKYSGIEFILYDRLAESGLVTEQPRTSDTKLILSTQPTFKGVGVHHLYVKAVFVDDEDYNSELSNETTYEVNTLASPVLKWASDLPTWNGKRIYESKLTWMPVRSGSATNAKADYYMVKVIGDGEQQGEVVTVLQPDTEERLGIYIPDPDPFNEAVNGLISQLPTKTTNYKVNVYSLSFNEFYVGGSEPATEDYKIIRLGAPKNATYSPDELKLSWDSVPDANLYYIYDNDIKIDETTDAFYKFTNIEDALHIFTITAVRITWEEE